MAVPQNSKIAENKRQAGIFKIKDLGRKFITEPSIKSLQPPSPYGVRTIRTSSDLHDSRRGEGGLVIYF